MSTEMADPYEATLTFQEEMRRMAEDELMDEEDMEDDYFSLDGDDGFLDEEGPHAPAEDLFSRLLKSPEPHKDARSMDLTADERQWALELKRAVNEDRADLHQLSDFEYAHFAIDARGNQALALGKITAMQAFREAYQVDHSVEQATIILGQFFEQQEGFFLNLDVDPLTLETMHALDFGACNAVSSLAPCPINGVDHNWRIFVCAFYYFNLVCQPCLATIRTGVSASIEFDDFGWKNFSMEQQYRFNGEFLRQYPIHFSRMCCFNTNQAANIFFSLVKKVLPSSAMKGLRLGCQLPVESHEDPVAKTLKEKYLQPSVEQSHIRMLNRARELLSLRHRNEELFRL